MNTHYLSADAYFREKFGRKLVKAAISLGTTCPNRDGTAGYGGCSFCAGGSASFAADVRLPVKRQLDDALRLLNDKTGGRNCGYAAYFQSYTSTYLPLEIQKRAYLDAVEDDRVEALFVATRPDCLGDGVRELLGEINTVKPVFVELGLQTANGKTANALNRGYSLEVFDSAAEKLKSTVSGTIVHLIIGLPGETSDDLVRSVRHVNAVRAEGVKLQLLHVLRGTRLMQDYISGAYVPLTLEEYAGLLATAIENLSPEIAVHRITGDGDKRILAAPLWSADKKRVLNYLNRRFDEIDLLQGSALQK